jgi:lipopolysaccharide transport system ATP-binding protein
MSSSVHREFALQAEGIGKRYLLARGGTRPDTIRDLLSRGFTLRSKDRARDCGTSQFWALKDVSFEIAAGENVGIIGLNGAGKSTLLKVLARIVEPTTGIARVRGRVGALLEVGTGFHWELSGRENVFLYGSILGMSKTEIARKLDAIVDFAGVEEFLDLPVKRYSSGMYVRLAFAVAAHLEPDILFVDEVLSVGDLPFQRKCIDFAKRLQDNNATIVFVSHNMFSIKTMCRRVLYLKHGELVFDGPTEDGIRLYEQDCRLSVVPWAAASQSEWVVAITSFETLDALGRPRNVFDHGEIVRIRIGYETRKPLRNPGFIVAFIRSDGVPCCNFSSELDGMHLDASAGKGIIELETPPLKLVSELYTLHVLVREDGLQKLVCAQIGGTLHVRHSVLDMHFGVFHEAGRWTSNDSTSETQRHDATRSASLVA